MNVLPSNLIGGDDKHPMFLFCSQSEKKMGYKLLTTVREQQFAGAGLDAPDLII